MKDELFTELLESVRQGGAILRGELKPSRMVRVDEPDFSDTVRKATRFLVPDGAGCGVLLTF